VVLVLLIFVGYAAYFFVAEAMARRLRVSHEVSRKVEHVIFGISIACLPAFISFRQIALLGILFVPAVLISKSAGFFRSVHRVRRRTNGELYFAVAIATTALLFPRSDPFIYAMLVLGIGDGLAALVGQPLGAHKYRLLGSRKSYEGSMTFFVVTIGLGLALGLSVTGAVSAAAILAVIEGALSGGLDNLFLPVVAALLFERLG
jgi:phytol kinase